MLIKKGARSIRTDVLIVLLGLTTTSIIIIAYLGINSTVTTGNEAQQITAANLRSQAEGFLVQLTEATAEKNDIILENVRKEVTNVADYARNIFENHDNLSNNIWKFDNHVAKGKEGQYLNGQEDVSSVFIPNFTKLDNDLKNEMELSAFLDYIFPQILRNDPNAFAIYFIGHGGELRYYPNAGIGNLVPPDMDFTKADFFSLATPENDPQQKVVWTPLYEDLAGLGLMITTSAPIYTKQKGFAGVLSIDVTLKSLAENIEAYNPIENSYSFLIDKDGYSIALPKQAYKDILGRNWVANETRTNLNNITNEFGSVIDKMKGGSTSFQNITIDNKELYVAYTPLKSTGFSLGIVVEKAMMLKAVSDLQKEVGNSIQNMIYFRILPIGLLILVVAWTGGFLYVRRIIQPIKILTKTAEEISKGNLNAKSDIKSNNEIGQLASAFNQMTRDLKISQEQIKKHAEELEQKVADRTKELDTKIKELTDTKTAVLNMMEDTDETNKELVETQEELKRNLEELKNLDVKKDEFISIAAHELKTPLTSIHGFSQLLQNRDVAKNPEKREKYLKIMDSETKRLAKLVTDILDLSRIDLGMVELNPEEVDMNKLMEDVEREMNVQVKGKGLTSEYDIEKGLPKIVTDKERLTEILINLINNAVKYTPKGRITVKVSREKDNVHFVVKDTGIGIAKEYHDKLFQRFYQIDSSYTRKAGGTGLGLALCKEFLELLGGKIWFESEVDKGSEFHFTLPIKGSPKKYVRGEERKAGKRLKKSEEVRKRTEMVWSRKG